MVLWEFKEGRDYVRQREQNRSLKDSQMDLEDWIIFQQEVMRECSKVCFFLPFMRETEHVRVYPKWDPHASTHF